MKKEVKFLGGAIKFRDASDFKAQDGSSVHLDKAVILEMGKHKIQVGSDFFERVWGLQGNQDVEQFIADLE